MRRLSLITFVLIVLSKLLISLLFISLSCNSTSEEKTFICNGKSITINLPKLIDEKEHRFEEGKTELL